jgi:hypothetical protein
MSATTQRAYPPDLGSHYSWPHGPDCVYVLSRGIEWCTCRGQFEAPAASDQPPSATELLAKILEELTSIDGRLHTMEREAERRMAGELR